MTPMMRTAVHEAGHAVMAYLHGGTIEHINARAGAGGNGATAWQRASGCDNCDPLVAAFVSLAGGAAEALYFGEDDDDDAAVIVRASAADQKRVRKAVGECAHSSLEAVLLTAWLRVHVREMVRTARFRYLTEALALLLTERGSLDAESAAAALQRADLAFDEGDALTSARAQAAAA